MATTLREGVDIINSSLKKLGYDYNIDTTSNETMTAGLEAVGAFPPSQLNALMEQMNLVIQQRNYGVMFDATKNDFRNFLVDMITTGFGIEDVFHEILAGTTTLWDGSATAQEIANDLVAYKTNDIGKFFHIDGDSRKFDATIDTRNYEKVFTPYGVTRYIDTRLANLSWSAEYWLMSQVVGIIQKMITDGKMVFNGGHNVNSKEGVNDTVETLISLVDGFKTPSSLYNYGYEKDGVVTPVINMTNDERDVFIVTTPELLARIKVHGYSNAFNLSEYELKGKIIFAPAGTDLGTHNGEQVLAVVLDRRAIVVGLKRWLATTFFVSNTGWTNHFLNVEILKGYNTVFNAVAVTGESVDDFFGSNNTANRGAAISVFGGIVTDVEAFIETDGVLVTGALDDNYEALYERATYVIVKDDVSGGQRYNLALNGIDIVRSATGVEPYTLHLNDGDIVTITPLGT